MAAELSWKAEQPHSWMARPLVHYTSLPPSLPVVSSSSSAVVADTIKKSLMPVVMLTITPEKPFILVVVLPVVVVESKPLACVVFVLIFGYCGRAKTRMLFGMLQNMRLRIVLFDARVKEILRNGSGS